MFLQNKLSPEIRCRFRTLAPLPGIAGAVSGKDKKRRRTISSEIIVAGQEQLWRNEGSSSSWGAWIFC